MSAPTNTSPGAALVIGALPYTVTLTTTGETSALELWWRYTAIDNDRVVGITPFATITSNYEPTLRVFESDATTIYKGISAPKQRSVAIPVTAGETYYFRVIQGAGGTPLDADLTFSMVRAPQDDAPAGAIISTQDEVARFKPPILSTDSAQIYQFIDDFGFMEAAIGTTLDDGTMCGDDTGTGGLTVQIWSSALVRLYDGIPSYDAGTPQKISSNGTSLFYLEYQVFGNPSTLRTLTAQGNETAEMWTLPANSDQSRGGSPDRDETIYYYGQKATSGSAVHRYDLVNSIALTDLAATLGSGWSVFPIIVVLADGTVLVGYDHLAATIDHKVIRYSVAGAVLQTYDFGANKLHFLGAGLDDASFFVRVFDASVSDKRSIYYRVRTSDGAILGSATYDHFDVGIDQVSYDPTYPANDGPAFGVASTCTCFVIRQAIVANPVIILPPTPVQGDPIRRQRTSPHLWDGESANRIFYPGFQLLFEAGGPRDVDQAIYFDLEWSDDGGHTWSNVHRIQAGQIGQYRYRAIWRRLGSGRDRIFRVTESNPAKIVWLAALLDPDPTQGTS